MKGLQRKKSPQMDTQRRADIAKGRIEGIGDALLLLGLGVGLGLASALTQPRTGKCTGRTPDGEACRHDAGHGGVCEPNPRSGS